MSSKRTPARNSVKSASPGGSNNIAIAQRQGGPVGARPEPIVVQNGDRTVRFTPITKELIRIEDIGPGRQFVDDPTFFAMNRDRAAIDPKVKPVEAEGETVLDTGVMRLTFRPDGRPLHRGNLEIRTSPGAAGLAAARPWRWHPEKRNQDQANLGGGFRTLDLFGVDIDQHGGLQLDNGILSRQGFFCYDDSRGPIFDRTGRFPRPRRDGEGGADLYVFGYGRDYASAQRSLAMISGPVPMPPARLMGVVDAWWQVLTDQDYLRRIREYGENGYTTPDVETYDMEAFADRNPKCSWSRTEWNLKLIPDPRRLNAEMAVMKVTTMINLHPHGGIARGTRGYEPLMDELKANGFLKDHPANPENGAAHPDFADPRYFVPWLEYIIKPLFADGLRGIWSDYQPKSPEEPWREPDEMTSIDGLPIAAMLAHLLYLLSSEVNFSGEPGSPPVPRRGALFARFERPRPGRRGPEEPPNLLGGHRYPMQWSGDMFTRWFAFAAKVPLTVASANVLAAHWSHDAGGLLHEKEPEMLARDLWFQALSGGIRHHGFNPAARCDSDPVFTTDCDPRPWLYGEACTRATRLATDLRSRLFPEIYSAAFRCHLETRTPMRGMYIDHPLRRQAYANSQQYLFSEQLLVAPITRPGEGPGKVATQAVWFPDGAWHNFFTHERYTGDDRLLVSADLDEVPLFVRAGVPVAMQPVSKHMGSEQVRTLVVRAYPGRDSATGSSSLYEDDRDTTGYLRGEFATTPLRYTRDGNRSVLEVGATGGTFHGQPEARALVFEFAATGPAKSVQVQGRPLDAVEGAEHEYDDVACMNLVKLPARTIREGVAVAVECDLVPAGALAGRALDRRLRARFEDPDTDRPLAEQIADRARALVGKNADDDDRLRGLLDLAGIGFLAPQSGPYGWNPFNNRVLQPFFGSNRGDRGKGGVTAENIKLVVKDKRDDGSTVILKRSFASTRSGRENIPLPALESNRGAVERFVTLRFTVGGEPVTLTRCIGKTCRRRANRPENPDPNDETKPRAKDWTKKVTCNGDVVAETDCIGLAQRGEEMWVDEAIRKAVGRHRGPKGLGCPAPSAEGGADGLNAKLARRQGNGWVQTFKGATDGCVMHRDGTAEAFVVSDVFWDAYQRAGGLRVLGYALGDAKRAGPAGDEGAVRIQEFENGEIRFKNNKCTVKRSRSEQPAQD